MDAKKEIVIDSHSHLGFCRGWVEAVLPEYLSLMDDEGVDIGFLFPVPWELDFEKQAELYLNWRYVDGKTEYFSTVLSDIKAPYRDINAYIAMMVKEYQAEKELFFIPMIHPYLDSAQQIEAYIDQYDPIAIKIHGTGSGIEPQKIPADRIEVLKRSGRPLILHTDYARSSKDAIVNSNSPASWAKWLLKHDLNGCLAHGARLDKEALDIINKYDNVVLSIAPCHRVSKNAGRLGVELNSYDPYTYLAYLRDYVNNSKILFDLDYSWNRDVPSNNPVSNTSELVRAVFKDRASDVLSKNAIRFYQRLQQQSRLLKQAQL